jgi:Flp pilus assembly protein TadG
VEFAVVLPLLLVMTVGLVDFGRAAYEAIAVENAAYAGASYGVRSPTAAIDETGIRTAAMSDINENLSQADVGVTSERYCECPNGTSVDCSTKCSGVNPLMYIRVRVDKKFKTVLSYPGIPHEVQLAREARLRVR